MRYTLDVVDDEHVRHGEREEGEYGALEDTERVIYAVVLRNRLVLHPYRWHRQAQFPHQRRARLWQNVFVDDGGRDSRHAKVLLRAEEDDGEVGHVEAA